MDSTINNESIATGLKLNQRFGFKFVRIILGVLLLTTAGLKLFDPSPDNFSGLDLLSSPRWRVAAIEVEALLGLWLLTGAYPRILWLAGTLSFSLLASVSLYLGIEGQPSCGCFGEKLSVSPWYALGLDLAAIAALLWWRPAVGYRVDALYSATIRRFLTVATELGVVLVLVLGGLSWTYGSPSEALLHFRGESITIDPLVTNAGDCQRLEARSFTIQLTNQTDHAIQVFGGTADCSCIATQDLPLVLPPRGSCSVSIQLELRGPAAVCTVYG